jgi:hypothetical protein
MLKHITLVFAFTLLVLASCDSGGPDFARGEAAFKKGDYAAALKEWRPLAEKGDAKA